MGQLTSEVARQRDIRLANTSLGVAIVLMFVFWGCGSLYRRATEEQAWAEHRCADVDPEHPTGSGDWYDCIDGELAKNAVEIAWPQMIGIAVGLGLVVLARRSGRDSEDGT